jgi:hypothetical protein
MAPVGVWEGPGVWVGLGEEEEDLVEPGRYMLGWLRGARGVWAEDLLLFVKCVNVKSAATPAVRS